jgi:hypothetical protein
VANLSHTYYIPVTPKQQALQLHLRRTYVCGPSVRGLAFNGVVFAPPAPTNVILACIHTGTFDDAEVISIWQQDTITMLQQA